MRMPRPMLPIFALLLLLPAPSGAATGDIGHEGGSYTGGGNGSTAPKPESKLWWNDGIWWASMWSPALKSHAIFRLDVSTQTWISTGTKLDRRSRSRADTLWDAAAGKLYVSSHNASNTVKSGYPSNLYRFSYDPATKSYTLDSGFPERINNYQTETLVIDKDGTGKLWATWVQGQKVYVNRTTNGDRTWGTPFVLPVSGVDVAADDISAVVAFNNRIGVMWSNQLTSAMYFAEHLDGAADTSWQASRTAIQGPNNADDHINLATLHEAGGRLFAVTKTSHSSLSAPLIMVLARSPSTGEWSSHVWSRVSDKHTRPIIVAQSDARRLHVFATGPQPPLSSNGEGGGTIYRKVSSVDDITFETGWGEAVLQDADVADINDATSTKQAVNATTGLVVLASNDATDRYWHLYDPLGGSPPTQPAPTPDFTASPLSGTAPLSVQFTDASTGSPTGWAWDFQDDGVVDSTAQNPNFTYSSAGTYTVRLRVSNEAGSNETTRAGLISVNAPAPSAPSADFTASPLSGTAPLSVQFTDASTGSPTGWAWDFQDDGVVDSTAQNPNFTYSSAGTHSVTLTASNAGGRTSITKSSYISASEPTSEPPRDSSTTVSASADAYVNQAYPTRNYGTGTTLRVRTTASDSLVSYLKFDIPELSGSVSAARLRLYVSGDSADGGAVHVVAKTWLEGTITWNAAPSTSGAPIIGQAGRVALGWAEITLDPAAVEPGTTLSVALRSASTNGAVYHSRENSTNQPQLVLTGPSTPSAPPVADFSGAPSSGNTPLTVQFTDTSSGTPTSWQWDLDGDGSIDSTDQHPQHLYADAGHYTVTLTVANSMGQDMRTRNGYVSVIDPGSGGFSPFGTVELTPQFAVDGSGSNVDSIAFWEAPDPAQSLMFVTAKSNELVEVWRYPFNAPEHQQPALRHETFATDSNVNGVAVDQATDRLYVAVSAPRSTISVFELPSLSFVTQYVDGSVGLGLEPNLTLLSHPAGTRLYASADSAVHILDAASGARLGGFTPAKGMETLVADSGDQVLYIPDENDRTGVYAYTNTGDPYARNGTNLFGQGIFQEDAEGILLYTCPSDGTDDDGRGLIVASDQRQDITEFEFFDRQTWAHLGAVTLTGVNNTDGIASTQRSLPNHALGVFAMIDDDDSVAGIGWDRILAATGLSCSP